MKLSHLSKIAGASAIALSMAVMPLTLPASAQTDTAPNTAPGTTVETVPTDRVAYETDDGFDWGWLGLLGLAGLAGLAGRKRQEPTAYRDPNTVSTTGYRD